MTPKVTDTRFLKTDGIEAYTGNELLLKGALEAGVGLITGYPGSPVSELFDVIPEVSPYLAERGIVAQIAHNEALAAARLNGARQAGLRALAVMKSVGFHVGADALAVGNLMEIRKPTGGAMIIVGDDPWNETTQINSDSRFLSQHLHMPIVEPSTFQEIKDWVNAALDISGKSDLYVTYILTTNQADGGGTVEVFPHPTPQVSRKSPATLSDSETRISDTVLIPPHTSMREATLKNRFERALARAKELKLNQTFGPSDKAPIGFICAGLPFGYLREALELVGLWDTVPVLKLGMTYPLDQDAVLDLAKRVQHIIVVEEKRGFLETQVARILTTLHQEGAIPRQPALWGKQFPDGIEGFPETRGLNVSVILSVLGPVLLRWKSFFPSLETERIDRELSEVLNTAATSFEVPVRTPTFCPGCPHRDSATISLDIKKKFKDAIYMKEEKGADPVNVVFHGESGCHSMLQFAPNEGLMQNYSGMGVGGGTGAGMAPFVTNNQVVFLGDSTFFHSGMIAVSDSIKNSQNITYVILDNKTTAMTGHQPTPESDRDIMGFKTVSQDIERVLRGMAPAGLALYKINPAEREKYQELLEKIVLEPGVKVVIADKECAITFHRRKNKERKQILKKDGFIQREEKINITPDVCEYCLECTRQTACPGLTVEETPYGRKIATDLSTCVDDGACSRTKACPSFEKVTITRSQAPKRVLPARDASSPVPAPHIQGFEHRWSAYTAGVGGMGAGIVNSVLVRAGMKEGFDVSFLDKKGLAIRNGGVYGHVVFSKSGPINAPVIAYGKADLLVGLDLLEAARATDSRVNLRVAHPGRTKAVINNHKHETVLSLLGKNDFDPSKLEGIIQARAALGGFFSTDFSELSERYLGSKLYANVMILGAAFQKGWIPVSEENLRGAIVESVRKEDVQLNLEAFEWGRYFTVNPESLKTDAERQTVAEIVEEKADYLKKRFPLRGLMIAHGYRRIMTEALRWMDLPDESRAFLARAVYDLVRYGGVRFAQSYVALLGKAYRHDQEKFGFEATRVAMNGLFRVMAIKDEVWVAELLTSPEKYARDRQRFHINPAAGDKISYVHLNRPEFTVFGRSFMFNLNTKDWMLSLMRHGRFLRALLPQWHEREKAFRDWYIQLVEKFSFFQSAQDYEHFVSALKVHEGVRGYRHIRYPQMEEAMKKGDAFVAQIGARQSIKINTVL